MVADGLGTRIPSEDVPVSDIATSTSIAKPTAQTDPNQTKLRFSDAVKSVLFNRNLSSPTNGHASNTESKSSSNSNSTIKLDSTIRNVLLTAVHSDLQDKERRRRNVIIYLASKLIQTTNSMWKISSPTISVISRI